MSVRTGKHAKMKILVAAYMANGGNGVEAARTAGHRGTNDSLAVTASRAIHSPEGQKLLNANVAKLEKRIKLDELFDRLSAIARLPDTELADMKDFFTLITPERAVDAIKKTENLDEARASLDLIGSGFVIDLEKALKLGKTHLIKELTHDAGTGAPKIKLQDNLAVWELSRKALAELATLYGLKKGTPAPPDPPKLALWRLLEFLPNDVLLALKNAVVQAKEQQKALLTTAKRVD